MDSAGVVSWHAFRLVSGPSETLSLLRLSAYLVGLRHKHAIRLLPLVCTQCGNRRLVSYACPDLTCSILGLHRNESTLQPVGTGQLSLPYPLLLAFRQ
jgi:hypothetical protein